MTERKIYLCNPDLNTKCAKTGCGYIREDGPCFRTTNPEFAAVDEDGQPIEAAKEDKEMIDRAWKIHGSIIGYEKGGCNGDYCEL
jgi:hypothetical protein